MNILDLFKPDVFDGEVVDDAPTVDFDTVVTKTQSEIAWLENENRPREAQALQAGLGDFVAKWFRGGK